MLYKKIYDGINKCNCFMWHGYRPKITKKNSLVAALSFLFTAPVHAAQVTFSAAITARGDETTGFEQRTYGGHFPYFEIQGNTFGGWPRREETVTYCLPPEANQCSVDASRSSGKGGAGYGVNVTSINSPGGAASESYTLNGRCLTLTVSVQAKRLQRGWYESDYQIFASCPIRAAWSRTETKGPFTLDSNSGYSYITNYTGPIGSPSALPGTATVYNNDNGYKVTILNKNPANAVITSGMFINTPAQGNNGPRLYALYSANDVMTRGLEISQGVQNLQNDMPLVAGRRTYARLYASATNTASNINAQLRAFKNGAELNGSPINAETTIPVRNASIDRTILDHAFLFKLPYAWTTSGAIEFRATVDPQGLGTDADPNNNNWTESITFQNGSGTTNVIVDVPLKIHQNGDKDQPYFIYESSAPTYYPIVDNLSRMHPISGMIHFNCGIKPLKPTLGLGNWDISNSNHWSRMLWRVSLARVSNGCGVQESYWQGMVHPSLNNRRYNGIAYSINGNQKSSVVFMSGQMNGWSMPLGSTFAHELGHNKGLDHVCNIDSPDGVDGSYPYTDTCEMARGANAFFANGHDGYFMLDIYHDFWGLNEPAILGNTSTNVTFPTNRVALPLMSYGAPRWISPYSYCMLLDAEGISCNKQLISSHLPKANKASSNSDKTSLLAQQQTKHHLHHAHADRAPNTTPPATVQPLFGAQNAVLPAGYRPNVLSNNAPGYFLVAGLYDVSKPTLDVFSLMKLSSLPGVAALAEANKFQTELLNRNTTVFSEVLVLNQYNNLVTRSLLKADIVADLAANDTDSNTSERYIAQFVEAASGVTYFELTYGSHVVATMNASNSAPSLTVIPFAETSLTADSVIRWNAFDADNNALTFSIYYRRDTNTPWHLIDTDVTGNEYRMRDNLPAGNTNPLSYYAGSPAGVFRVVAHDGFHTTIAESNAIQVPSNTPRVSIKQQDGLAIKLGQSLYFNGHASDVEDGPIPSISDSQAALISGVFVNSHQLKWTSNINGALGQGPELITRNLSRGNHIITLSVTDSNGLVGSASIRVSVGMETIIDNIAPAASTSASSTYCPSGTPGLHCYFPSRVNDGSTNTALGGNDSWVNNNVDSPLPQWVQLQWSQKMVITGSELFTSESYAIQDYDMQSWNGVEWVSFVSIVGNTALQNTHKLEANVVTDRVRVLARRGPSHQPQHARVNEVIIKGYPLSGSVITSGSN